MDEFCDPFSGAVSNSLVNVATGRAASKATESYLVNMLKRGRKAREKFLCEWDKDSNRFLKPVKRTRVENFAAENANHRPKTPASEIKTKTAESLRDMFIWMVIVVSQNTTFDLWNILSYPITEYPLSLSHCDGTRVTSVKSALLTKMEALQKETITEAELPQTFISIYDGGLVLHSVLSQTSAGASYASIARSVLSTVCSGRRTTEVHLCLDKYVKNSIKDSERKLHGAIDSPYVITGPEQKIRQSGHKLLNNGNFKNEIVKFFWQEWKKDHYYILLAGKTLFASCGGECYQYVPDDECRD